MKDYRVLSQYINAGVQYFKFTTVLADSPEEAEVIASAAHRDDFGFKIVQTFESNGVETGFTQEELADAYIAHANREAARATEAGVQTDG